MLENKCNDDGTLCHSPIRPRKRTTRTNEGHELLIRPKFTSPYLGF